jgi:hypothetical protein
VKAAWQPFARDPPGKTTSWAGGAHRRGVGRGTDGFGRWGLGQGASTGLVCCCWWPPPRCACHLATALRCVQGAVYLDGVWGRERRGQCSKIPRNHENRTGFWGVRDDGSVRKFRGITKTRSPILSVFKIFSKNE